MPTVMIHDKPNGRYFRARVTPTWYRRHDNGTMVSIGLTVGRDLTRAAFNRLQRQPNSGVREVSHTEWNHSGCQSSCVLRGALVCRW